MNQTNQPLFFQVLLPEGKNFLFSTSFVSGTFKISYLALVNSYVLHLGGAVVENNAQMSSFVKTKFAAHLFGLSVGSSTIWKGVKRNGPGCRVTLNCPVHVIGPFRTHQSWGRLW